MARVLCVYYSRTGKTKRTMEKVAQALNAELIEITDGVNRRGAVGCLRSCLDAVRKSTRFLEAFQPSQPVGKYDAVIVGTPIWAGRCSSVVREFLKKYGRDCRQIAYVVTRGMEENRQEAVFQQMDLYTARPHLCAVSLKADCAGEDFWREEFLREFEAKLAEQGAKHADKAEGN